MTHRNAQSAVEDQEFNYIEKRFDIPSCPDYK
jgi:hypothetical protein